MSAKKKNEPIVSQQQAGQLISTDDMFPEELNKHFLYQIKTLTSDNGDLRCRIKEKEDQIEKMAKTICSLQEDIQNVISTGGPGVSAKSAGIISSKITDLCKQNRHMVAELESYKTKYACLERKFLLNESRALEKTESKTDEEKIAVAPSKDELKELQDKLTASTKKLIDSRNKQIDLKNELLVANKCLQNELGPSFQSIQKLALDPIGFKGRAQEIIVLKNKISELEEKLYGFKNKNIVTEMQKETNVQVIRDIEARRRNQMDQTLKDYEVLQIEYAEVKKKLEGAMARIKVLICEGVQLRQTIQHLTDKSLSDDKIKDELALQQKSVEKQYQELLKDISNSNDDIRSSHHLIEEDLKNEQFRVTALNDKLEEKNKKIEQLNTQLSTVIETSLQKVYFTPLQIAADNEIKILSGLLDKTNKRLDEERRKYMDLEKRYLKTKSNKLSRKCSDFDMEIKEIAGRKSKSGSSVNTSVKSSSLQFAMRSTVQGATGHVCPDNCKRGEIEMLNNRLEVAQEQIKFLETRLVMLEDERAADFESIDQMIIKSKKIFAEALKKFQETK